MRARCTARPFMFASFAVDRMLRASSVSVAAAAPGASLIRWIEPLIEPLTGVPVHPNAIGEEQDAFDFELAMLRHGVR